MEFPLGSVPVKIFIINAKIGLRFVDGSMVIHGVQTHRVFLAEIIVVFEKKRIVVSFQDYGGF